MKGHPSGEKWGGRVKSERLTESRKPMPHDEGEKPGGFFKNHRRLKGGSQLLRLPLVLFFISLLSAAQPLCGQAPEISHLDMPYPDLTVYLSQADTLDLGFVAQQGENQLWDFSDLLPSSQRKDSFINLFDLPFAYGLAIPEATVVRYIPTPDSILDFEVNTAYQFFRNTPEAWEEVGFGAELSLFPFPLVIRRNPRDRIFDFPLRFGDRDTVFSEATAEVRLVGVYYQTRQTRTSEVDAWGEVKTPFGTFPALRIKSRIERRDSVSIGDTTRVGINLPTLIEYKWLSPGQPVPVLEITLLQLGPGIQELGTVSYLDTLRREVSTPIRPVITGKEWKVYPQPAQGWVTVEGSPSAFQGNIYLFDRQGKLVRQWIAEDRHPLFSLSLEGLPPGPYVLTFTHSLTYSKVLWIK